ncbi:unnamed protein product [Cylicostephanus goldi]|uniref:Receptor ligand binding region domain-containing protein n=1 Tax=Cylicostephanus goldi TaxID=71465 RepID=A0A3P6TA02_CYLGO|nr:unnamed protein product [Cylicostephanus goldi]
MDHFKWNSFAFIYSADEDSQKCPIFVTDVQAREAFERTFMLSDVSTAVP